MPKSDPRRLVPASTFVVQLRAGSDATQGQLSGRVEHVVSGESEPFTSLDALLSFMARFTQSGSDEDT